MNKNRVQHGVQVSGVMKIKAFLQHRNKNKTVQYVAFSKQTEKQTQNKINSSNQRGGLFGSLCEVVRLTSAATARRWRLEEEGGGVTPTRVGRFPGIEMLVQK